MKLAELKAHQVKHKDADEVPAIEHEDAAFREHVRELYQEIKPRPDKADAGAQWDRELDAILNVGHLRVAGVTIRRV